jgi:hypothetical protein
MRSLHWPVLSRTAIRTAPAGRAGNADWSALAIFLPQIFLPPLPLFSRSSLGTPSAKLRLASRVLAPDEAELRETCSQGGPWERDRKMRSAG